MHVARSVRGIWRALALAVLVLGLAGGCASTEEDPTAGWSRERLYSEAKRAMDRADFQQAIDYFETLEARYPFGDLALQAQLDIAYAYYQYGEYASSISAADRFIKLHPTHEGVAYAYYLRGLVRYNKGRSLLNNVVPRDLSQADPNVLRKAFSDFQAVVEEHPGTRYAPDAQKRMVYLRNELAEHELSVAEFYFKRSAYTAAVNRVNYLLAHYDGAPAVPDALALQWRAYRRMQMPDLAEDTRKVLARNWPQHPALDES